MTTLPTLQDVQRTYDVSYPTALKIQAAIPHVRPVGGEPTRFWCPSSRADHEPHMVDLDYDGKPACSCEDHMVRNRRCWHICAVREFKKL